MQEIQRNNDKPFGNEQILQSFPGQIQQLLLSDVYYLKDCINSMTNIAETFSHLVNLSDPKTDKQIIVEIFWMTYFEHLRKMITSIPETIQKLCTETLENFTENISMMCDKNEAIVGIYDFLKKQTLDQFDSEFERHTSYHKKYMERVKNPSLYKEDFSRSEIRKFYLQKYIGKIKKLQDFNPSLKAAYKKADKKFQKLDLTPAELQKIRKEERQELQKSLFQNSMYEGMGGSMFLGPQKKGNIFESVLIGADPNESSKRKFNVIKEGQFKSELITVDPVSQNETIIKLLKQNHSAGSQMPEIHNLKIDEKKRNEKTVLRDVMISSLPEKDEVLFFGSTFKLDTLKIEKSRKNFINLIF